MSARAQFESPNRACARIIFADIELSGGEELPMVRWARMVWAGDGQGHPAKRDLFNFA